MQDKRHYLQRSESPVLGYEHIPGKTVQWARRRLQINAHGIRADTDDTFGGRQRIGLLGDSVTFGVTQSQDQTLSALLQVQLDEQGTDAAVINLGTAGYGLEELAEYLPLKDAVYDLDTCIYIFNPNDFSRRNSIYEGGDNGSYRMYYRPVFTSLWFLTKTWKKLISRGNPLPWYRFIYHGNRDRGFADLEKLVRYAKTQGIKFAVVLMPSEYAYRDSAYLLDEEYTQIQSYLRQRDVAVIFPREEFSRNIAVLYDTTDHLRVEGNLLMISVLLEVLDQLQAAQSRTGSEG